LKVIELMNNSNALPAITVKDGAIGVGRLLSKNVKKCFCCQNNTFFYFQPLGTGAYEVRNAKCQKVRRSLLRIDIQLELLPQTCRQPRIVVKKPVDVNPRH
jgi:hypothetical protein